MNLVLRPYQVDLLNAVEEQWAAGHKNVCVMAPTGAGKCLGRDTPVLMYDGTIKRVQDVAAGDLLMGPDSRPRNVLSVTSGQEMLYRVTPTKGDSYVVNESHILSLKATRRRAVPRWKSEIFSTEPVNVSVTEYLSKSDTWRHCHKGWRTGVDFPPKEYPKALPPYILGLWLGDGDSDAPGLTSMDPEIVVEFCDFAFDLGMQVRFDHQKNNRAVSMQVTTGRGPGLRHGRNPFRNALKDTGVMNNKHIPHSYKTGSRKQRLELLAGLMDTDGSLASGYFDYISVSETLANDVAFVARSLGFASYISPCQKASQNGTIGTYYRVSISGDVGDIPCRLPRKQAPRRQQIKSVLVTGIKVEPIGVGDYFGFEIDGDRLFLLGDFTVTHNTAIIGEAVRKHRGPSCVIAHRDNLILQLSVALARSGVQHRIIASDKTLRTIAAEHARLFGRTYLNPSSQCAVASVQTLAKRDNLAAWCATVTLWVQDELHHLAVSGNPDKPGVWEKCINRFTHPDCRGLGPTATPGRADGNGLGRHADGFMDIMVALVDRPDGTLGVAVGNEVTCAPARVLIDQGYLSRYKVACVESHITEFLGEVAKSGDWSQAALKSASEHSSIIGDVVASYRQFADGKIGITFATDVETAGNIARAYREAGVSAEVLTGETDPSVRRAIFQRLEDRTLQQVVAVDVISEGTDIPAIEVVTFARPTASLGLFLQMLGRALRMALGKEYAQIIDHVGNFLRHRGGPDTPRTWTLDRRASRASGPSDATPIRVCLNVTCGQPYERFRDACPFCGTPAPEPERRGPPDQVEGVLALLDDETLLRLRGETIEEPDAMMTRLVASGLPGRFAGATVRKHRERIEVLAEVTALIGRLGGQWRAEGLSDTEMQRRWYQMAGVDVLTAQRLDRADAEKLLTRLSELV